MRLVLENDTQVRPVGLDSRDRNCECWATLILLSFFSFFFFCPVVFATNFRVKASMKNSVLLSWEIRDKNPVQPFTVRRCIFGR